MRTPILLAGVALGLLLATSVLLKAQTAPATGAASPAAVSAATVSAATVPAASASAPARGGRGAGGTPATPADLAEIAKLADLPAYKPGLGDGDYSAGPLYKVAPEDTVKPGVPRGKIVTFTMNSADSKIFPGNPPFRRNVAVYIPSQYVPGTASPFIISCDQYGLSPRTGHFQNTLDNMIAEKRLPVMCAIMVASGGTQRSMEYDTVSARYADFVETEVLPRVEKETGITLTKDPEGRMTYGGSSGGIAALSMAWFYPERYHRVVAYSATLVNLQRNEEYPHGGWEYPERLVLNNPPKPLRIWLEVAQNDNGANTASSGYRNWVIANARMAAALKAKGYHYQFVYAKDAGHTDSKVMSDLTPQALEFVWKDFPIAGAK